jgi:hypothetical protein
VQDDEGNWGRADKAEAGYGGEKGFVSKSSDLWARHDPFADTTAPSAPAPAPTPAAPAAAPAPMAPAPVAPAPVAVAAVAVAPVAVAPVAVSGAAVASSTSTNELLLLIELGNMERRVDAKLCEVNRRLEAMQGVLERIESAGAGAGSGTGVGMGGSKFY